MDKGRLYNITCWFTSHNAMVISVIALMMIAIPVSRGQCTTVFINLTNPGDNARIMSPNYPHNYPARTDCTWIIQTPTNGSITVTFIDYETEMWFDFLSIYDDTETENDDARLLHLSGPVAPSTVIASGGRMMMQFSSDSSVQERGFAVDIAWTNVIVSCEPEEFQCESVYVCLDNKLICDGYPQCNDNTDEENCGYCGDQDIYIAQDLSHLLNSPNYPDDYPPLIQCYWLVTMTTLNATTLAIIFVDFRVTNAVFEVGLGHIISSNKSIFELSGSSHPRALIINSSSVWISLISDSHWTERGFQLLIQWSDNATSCFEDEFTCSSGYGCWNNDVICDGADACADGSDEQGCNLCGQQMIELSTGDTFNITSPLFPDRYPKDFVCTWFVTSRDNGRPVIEVIVFETREFFHNVEVGEGSVISANSTVVRMSGLSVPRLVLTNTTDIWLRFDTTGYGRSLLGFVLQISISNAYEEGCPPFFYQCPYTFVCMDAELECDGLKQCLDGIDEANCDFCGPGNVNLSEGVVINITSPLYPRQYPVFSNCIWYLTANHGLLVIVRFVQFRTESGYDYLKVGYGSNVSLDTEVISLTGQESPKSIVGIDGAMWLQFTSDRAWANIGFHVEIWSSNEATCDGPDDFQCGTTEYTICFSNDVKCDGKYQCKDFTDELECGVCGARDIFLQEGQIYNLTSVSYPHTYPNDLSCIWSVKSTSESLRLMFIVKYFKLERGYDFLSVQEGIGETDDGEFHRIAHMTGSIKVTKIISRREQAWMHFVTDRTGGATGFHLEITQVENLDSYCDSEEFDCGGSVCTTSIAECDGYNDCGNFNDELACGNITCPGSYLCGISVLDAPRMCVPMDVICDANYDCPLHDDEMECDIKRCPDGCQCFYLQTVLQVNCLNGWNLTTLGTLAKTSNVLRLSGGDITVLQPGIFKGLTPLHSLSLSNNAIKTISPRAFDSLYNITWLDISNNNISFLTTRMFEELKSLKDLFIFDVPFERIEPDTFKGLTQLKYLVLIRNTKDLKPIDIHTGAFDGLHRLETVYVDDHRMCCHFPHIKDCITLEPQPPLFMCGSLMQNTVLRVAMWFLGFSALIGNAFSVIWRFNMKTRSTTQAVQSLLITNLAISDFFMGVYMIIIASADVYFGDEYFIHSDAWRAGKMCKFAGFLCLFSSESSVFFLVLISVDRLLSVVAPFSGARLTKNSTKVVGCALWGISFVVSIVPPLIAGPDSDFYDLSDVCVGLPLITRPATFNVKAENTLINDISFALPVAQDSKPAWFFSIAIFLGLNLICFVGIFACYVAVFVSLKMSSKKFKRKSKRQEQMKMAIRMAVIVGTDFCCWMPVIIMGILSQTGAAVIPLRMYTWSVVFILPINSSLNPYLYTIHSLFTNRKGQVGPSSHTNSMDDSKAPQSSRMVQLQHVT